MRTCQVRHDQSLEAPHTIPLTRKSLVSALKQSSKPLSRKGKTEYVHAHVTEAGQLALEVLSVNLPGTISKISFSKSMRWNSQVMFSRPIRWVMAIHGDVLVPFVFARVSSGNVSFGLRNTHSATVVLSFLSSTRHPRLMSSLMILF
ncbi:tRNA_synt_2f domain-containing protein [Cephalotus follicularis]|uniref:glycine--tRNA ligase n=1 Tax=Cephalotus follicularis TaxID=3775 RepID=A0A1Q3CSV7_CEPFO|nr:tRNA_synt_2f domain-containing protein [Cephalotus follicularis]